MKKKLVKVLVFLAAMDITDIFAKGCMLWWLKISHRDAYDDWNNTGNNYLRGRMITKTADFLYNNLSKK